jgi:transcriptional regulator with XRE-family HTH domain
LSHSTIEAALGDKLRQAREEAGLSQRTLADRIEISQNAICLYEQGKRRIPIDTVYDIARELDQPVSFFLECEDAVVISKGTTLYEIALKAQASPEDAKLVHRIFRFLSSQRRR